VRVDVNGVGIEVEVAGEGQPVVLLHGFPDSGRLWRHQVPVLADARFQVIVPDLRGFGASDKPEGMSRTPSLPSLATSLGYWIILVSSVHTSWATIGGRHWHGRPGL
jgi:pimeloyl-ACP methyl ester carboxylesterase